MSTITIISKPTNAEIAPTAQENGGVQSQTHPDAEVTPAPQETEDAQDNTPLDIEEALVPQESDGTHEQKSLEAIENTQALTSTPPKRKRKSKEERLQAALAKQAALDTKIAGLKKELDDTVKKTRNRGLILVGIVVEQCFKENAFTAEDKKWWLEQVKLLPDKDKGAYVEFLQCIKE